MATALMFCSSVASEYDFLTWYAASVERLRQTTYNSNNGGYSTPEKSYAQTQYGYDTIIFPQTGGYVEAVDKSGYLFVGWYTISQLLLTVANSTTLVSTNKRLTQDEIASGCYRVSSITGVQTYWAVAKYVARSTISYSISYNQNGGGSVASWPKTLKLDQSGEIATPTRTGYDFTGWSVSSGLDPATAKYSTNGTTWKSITSSTMLFGGGATKVYVKNLTELATGGKITLKANWQVKVYTVAFNANGGTGAPSNVTYEHFGSVTLPTKTPTKSGRTFLGWAKSATAKKSEFTPGREYTYAYFGGNITLYAVWDTPITITFDANGGTGAPSALTCEYNGSIVIPLTMPTLTGRTFKGWDLVKDSGALDFVAGRTYTYEKLSELVATFGDSNGNLKVYANWSVNQCVIVFDPNGGILPAGESGIKIGQYATYLSEMPTPSYTGATFVGWFTERAGGTEITRAQFYSNTRIFYAHWTVSTWSIRFCDPTGTNADVTREFTVGASTKLPWINSGLGWATPAGTTLDQSKTWSTVPGGEGTIYANNATVQDLAQPGRMIFLYANFQAPNVTITFNAGEGTSSETTRTVAKGSRIGPLPTATHGSKSFKGWKTSAGDIIDSTFVVTSSITLIAVYESLPVFDWWDVVVY